MANTRSLAALPLLSCGSHSYADAYPCGPEATPAAVCAMEAVAWLAGEKHSDAPACASKALTRCIITINDWSGWKDNKTRTDALLPLLPKLIGTRDSVDDMKLVDRLARFAVRVLAPVALDTVGLPAAAEKLRGLAADDALGEMRAAAGAAANAAYAAANAADAAADAAAYAAADAAAYAAYAAANAADAAAYAAYAADAAYAAANAAARAATYAAYAAANAAANAADAAYAAYTTPILALITELHTVLDSGSCNKA